VAANDTDYFKRKGEIQKSICATCHIDVTLSVPAKVQKNQKLQNEAFSSLDCSAPRPTRIPD